MAKPIVTPETNDLLVGPPGTVVPDLPIHRHAQGVISCWELTPEELEEVARTGRVWLSCAGITHPPVAVLGNYPFVVETPPGG